MSISFSPALVAARLAAAYATAAKVQGTVQHGNITLALTQDAYADNHGTWRGVRYYARAIDDAGNDYRVAWDTTAAWDAAQAEYLADPENAIIPDDESKACDWTRPVEIVNA